MSVFAWMGLCRSSYAVRATRQIMRLRWAGAIVRWGMCRGLAASAGVWVDTCTRCSALASGRRAKKELWNDYSVHLGV